MVRWRGDVTNSISKVSISRQKSAAEGPGEGEARHVSEPVGRAGARRVREEGGREARGRRLPGARGPLAPPPGPTQSSGLAGAGLIAPFATPPLAAPAGRGLGGGARAGPAAPALGGRRGRGPETRKTDAILGVAACFSAENALPSPVPPRRSPDSTIRHVAPERPQTSPASPQPNDPENKVQGPL